MKIISYLSPSYASNGTLEMRNLAKFGVLVMFALLCGTQLSAQCGANSAPVNEIGIRLGSVNNASSFGGRYIGDQTTNVGFLNGLHYKRYGTFGAFRTSIGLTRYEYENRRNCPDCLRTNGKVSGVTLRAGYEWFGVLGIFEPYIGIDAIGVFGTYKGETYSTNATNYQEYTDNRTRRGMGISPILGIRAYLSYAISISAETSLDLLFVGRSTTIARVSPESDTYARSNNYFETVYQPLNWLSLNVMF
jgi:hypothetical protein